MDEYALRPGQREVGHYSPGEEETSAEALICEIRQGALWTTHEAYRSPKMVEVMARAILENCNVILDRIKEQREYRYQAFFGRPVILGGGMQVVSSDDTLTLASVDQPVISVYI